MEKKILFMWLQHLDLLIPHNANYINIHLRDTSLFGQKIPMSRIVYYKWTNVSYLFYATFCHAISFDDAVDHMCMRKTYI